MTGPTDNIKFSASQQHIVDLLLDGKPHTKDEMRNCLPNPNIQLNSVNQHLKAIRKILRPNGRDILCVLVNRRIMYRLVRLLV